MAKKKPEEKAETYEFDKKEPEAEVEKVKEVVDKADYDNLSDRYLRLLADFENFKRRNAENGKSMYRSGKLDMIDSILPTLTIWTWRLPPLRTIAQGRAWSWSKGFFRRAFARRGKGIRPSGRGLRPQKTRSGDEPRRRGQGR